jgi:SNF2 family DNA or RNA helicase
MIYTPHEYQKFSTDHLIENKFAALLLQMGLGKTVSTLTALDTLIFDHLEVNKTLIIAPKKVAEDTWISEVEKWDHLKHLRLSIVLGTEKQRVEALRAKADIYVINRENVAWLVGFYGGGFPFDCLVIDELSSFKNPKSVRFKALRSVRPRIKRVIGLTGTPAPNGLLDLWAQIYLLDQGERLGKTLTSYRNKYFMPNKRNGMVIFDYKLQKEEETDLLGEDIIEKEIFDKLGDICISMKARDYLDLPERVDRTKVVVLPPEKMQKYLEFEKSLILAMDEVEDITVLNAAGLMNKLRQFANGAIYDEDKNWHEVHTEKLEALEEDIEEANGHPVLVFYQYRHDLERIMNHFKKYKPVILKGREQVKLWNEKKIPLMIAHAASAGHGLNLQYGGHFICWFGVDWSLELYEQGVARLDRQGQTQIVTNSRIITKGTVDEDVLAALVNKAGVQDAIMKALKARVAKYKGVQ